MKLNGNNDVYLTNQVKKNIGRPLFGVQSGRRTDEF